MGLPSVDVTMGFWGSTSMKQPEFKFTMTIPGNSGHGERRSFVWLRSSQEEVGDVDAYKWSIQNFRLLDEQPGRRSPSSQTTG